MHQITQNLKKFYNEESLKFHNTRKKHRPELDYLVKQLKSYPHKKIKVLELWCWDARCLDYVKKRTNKEISYIWIDISDKLIQIAQKKNPKERFICDDMNNIAQHFPIEHFDIIIAIASIQHLATRKQRTTTLTQCYKLLKHNGYLIQTNRSFSQWFLKKHRKSVIVSTIKHILSWGKKNRNDIMIRRIGTNKSHQRFYHIFTKKELQWYLERANFINTQITYIDNLWQMTQKRRNARNIFSVSKKSIKKS